MLSSGSRITLYVKLKKIHVIAIAISRAFWYTASEMTKIVMGKRYRNAPLIYSTQLNIFSSDSIKYAQTNRKRESDQPGNSAVDSCNVDNNPHGVLVFAYQENRT